MLPYPYGVGSHAEYVTGPARAFALKPAAIDHVQAGALVSLRLDDGNPALVEEAARLDVRAEVMLVEDDHAGMVAIARLAADGRLRAQIAGTFELADAAKAHELGDTGRTAGKLVLTMR
jgi:NADPH:quinone reductase-like Zn-dependent oxidoreductase